ncbi:MAG: RNA-binding domain-containing protein [archaeon]
MDTLPHPTSAEISTIAHATEDIDKVTQAIKGVCPTALRVNIVLRKTSMTGHHKNPITSLTAKISDSKATEQILENIAANLTPLDKSTLGVEIEDCIDSKGNLYLRFDKQAAYFGNLRLRQDDPIRLRVRFLGRPFNLESIGQYCRKVGLVE